jgi:hypothetical protein
MAIISKDSFTDANATTLTSHTADSGSKWTKHSAYASTASIYWNRVISPTATSVAYTGSPAGTDYSVEADFVVKTAASTPKLLARLDTSAFTTYAAEWDGVNGVWSIKRYNAGSATSGGTYSMTATPGANVHAKLTVSGSGATVTVTLYLNGVQRIQWSDTSGSRLTSAGVPGVFQNASNYITGIAIDNFLSKDAGSSDSIEINELNDYQILQRDSAASSSSNLTILGTYEGAPTGIEAKVVLASDGTTVVKDWTALASATIGNGFFSGTLSEVTNGGWYKILVRFANETDTTATGAKSFGVGILIGTTGQSNVANYFGIAGGTPNSLLRVFDAVGWYAPTGLGAITMGNKIVSETGLPVGLLNYAISGTALLSGLGPDYWLNTAATAMAAKYRHGIMECGGKIDSTLWVQGETEAKYTTAISTSIYKAGLDTLFGWFRTYANDASHPIHIQPLATDTESSLDNTKWENIRLAQIQALADSNNFFGGCGWDLAMSAIHYSNYTTISTRAALAILRRLGVKSYGYGPKIVNATRVSTTLYDINLSHDGGTDFTPTSGITTFAVFDESTPVTISSAVRTDASTIRLTLDTAVASPSIYFCYGYLPTVSAGPHDNTTDTLPLQPSGLVTIVDPTPPPATADDGIMVGIMRGIMRGVMVG